MSIEITGRITSYESLNRVILNSTEIYKQVRDIRAPTFIHFIMELSFTKEHPGLSGVLYVTDNALNAYLKEQYGDDLLDPIKFGEALTTNVSEYLDSAGHGQLSDFLPNCLPYWKGITDDGYYSGPGLMMLFDMNNYAPGSDGEKAVLIHYLILEFFRKEMENPTVISKPFALDIESWVERKLNLFALMKYGPGVEGVWINSHVEPDLNVDGVLVWNAGGSTLYNLKPSYIEIYGDATTQAYVDDFNSQGITIEKYWEGTISRITNILRDPKYVKYDTGGMHDKLPILDPKTPLLKIVNGKVTFRSDLPQPESMVIPQDTLKHWLKVVAVLDCLFNNPPVIK